ncbi:MAG: ribosomal protein L11 methyltransferase [Clostridiales bacterium 43-6]|nr:MAG: ribosomal protein L11 methyltransferase [Clostridiales bacterium 43-6]
MNFTELLIAIHSDDTDRASDIATMVVPYGIYIEDYTDLDWAAREIAHIDLIDEELLQKDKSKAFIHIYIESEQNAAEAVSFLKERFVAENINHTIGNSTVKEEDWENNWKQYFHTTEIGQKLMIHPSWEPMPVTDRRVLEIDPGAAFGTGTHESTKLCLEASEGVVKEGDRVLDLGSGSGILSIAAVLLGAVTAVGVDIDPVAVRVAGENAAKNHMTDQIKLYAGDILGDAALYETIGSETYDVIYANIVADVIIALGTTMKHLIKPGGYLISSGIIDTRKDEVVSALEASGFTILQVSEEKGWIGLVCMG